MAPWFNDSCYQARKQFKCALREGGKSAQATIDALKHYKQCCELAKGVFAGKLPDLLKYRPREFWKWVNHAPSTPRAITPEQFASHCSALYVDPSASTECKLHLPLSDEHMPPFEVSEVAEVLAQHFNGSASSGLCSLPSQVIKHLRGAALTPLTALLNKCTLE